MEPRSAPPPPSARTLTERGPVPLVVAPGVLTRGRADAGPLRREGPEKLTGEAKYADDLVFPGAWYGATVRSTEARARLLAIERLDVRHGPLQAVRGISLEVREGETLALVGANGAGKTTLLRAIAGAHRPAGGRILLEGADVTAVPAFRRVAQGIALVPEGRRLFPGMTVEENLLVARANGRPGPWTVERVLETFPMLRARFRTKASSLSGGEQQATAIGRALVTNPRVLLLDEVSLGLAPVAVDRVYQCLGNLITGGATVVLVEQDLSRAMRVATRVACMLEGKVVLEGAAAEMTREQITAAYFGLDRSAERQPA